MYQPSNLLVSAELYTDDHHQFHGHSYPEMTPPPSHGTILEVPIEVPFQQILCIQLLYMSL